MPLWGPGCHTSKVGFHPSSRCSRGAWCPETEEALSPRACVGAAWPQGEEARGAVRGSLGAPLLLPWPYLQGRANGEGWTQIVTLDT